MDEVIEDEDEALILFSSFLDDYETFVLTLINDKQFYSYNEVSSALVNHELRRKNKDSSNSTSAEVLTVRGRSFNRKERRSWEIEVQDWFEESVCFLRRGTTLKS